MKSYATVATCQMADVQDDVAKAIEHIVTEAERAKDRGASLVCFPECYLQGYTQDEAVARHRAFDLASAKFKETLSALAQCEPTLVFGLIETSGGVLFNTATVIQRGKLLGSYRKAHPNEEIFQAGDAYPIFETDSLRFGINICSDARYEDAASRLADQDIDAILYPLNNMLPQNVAARWRHKHLEYLRARARQTRAWVISSDVVGVQDDRVAYGYTTILDPDSVVVAKVKENETGMIIADVPLAASSNPQPLEGSIIVP